MIRKNENLRAIKIFTVQDRFHIYLFSKNYFYILLSCINKMDYYCDVCDELFKFKRKSILLQQTLTHNAFDECIQTKHKIESLDIFDIDEIFNEYITDHKKKFNWCLFRIDFTLVFDGELYPHIQTELQNKWTKFHLKR